MSALTVRTVCSIAEISELAWNSLRTAEDAPFSDWRFLEALEHSGCVGPDTGWRPLHFGFWRGSSLVGAAPAYIKSNTDGDFSRDWNLAAAAEQAGLPYFPKLVVTIPFTPVTGRRLLYAPSEDAALFYAAFVDALHAACATHGLHSLQVLFPTAVEAQALSALGLALRIDFQYHFRNPGYRNAEEFYARFSSKRRNALRREQAAPAQQGIALRTLRGAELAEDRRRWADLAYTLHRSTVDKLRWGRRWLNQEFYRRLFFALPAPLELVIAERKAHIVAGALNVAHGEGRAPLYGRYWGCLEDHPFLHFNVCYYHSIAECIARGIPVFEGGAGGEHKLMRGFEPVCTYAAHAFGHVGLDQALRRYIAQETKARTEALLQFYRESPILKPFSPGQGLQGE